MRETKPKPSQVESSSTESSLLAVGEGLQETDLTKMTVSDLAGDLENAAQEVEAIADEIEEKAQNIEDGFQHETQQSMDLRERADAVREWSETLSSAASDINVEVPERKDFKSDEEYKKAIEDIREEAENLFTDAIGQQP